MRRRPSDAQRQQRYPREYLAQRSVQPPIPPGRRAKPNPSAAAGCTVAGIVRSRPRGDGRDSPLGQHEPQIAESQRAALDHPQAGIADERDEVVGRDVAVRVEVLQRASGCGRGRIEIDDRHATARLGTRRISRAHCSRSARGRWCSIKVLGARSKHASAKGSVCAAACRNSAASPASRAFCVARSIISGDASMPCTLPPMPTRRRASSARLPVPQPTSSTASPGAMRARPTGSRRRRGGRGLRCRRGCGRRTARARAFTAAPC